MKQLNYLFLLLLLCINVSVFAQESANLQDTTVVSDVIEEVTVTAFRSPYNLYNTPAPVNLISPMQLKTGNSLTPIEALNEVPGVYMHNGTLNTNRLTIRGIGSRTPYATNKIKAYFGEIPLTTGDGETTLEDLENSAIKRVEIIKGPSSSLYGAGIAGVLLFHPKSVIHEFVQNETTIASFGTIKNILSAGIIQQKLNVYALGSMLKSNGFRDNNNTHRYNILVNSVYSVSDQSNVQLLLKATKMKAFIPSSLDYSTFTSSPHLAASNWQGIKGFEDYSNAQAGLSFNHFTANNAKISAATFGSLRKTEELRPFNLLNESSGFIGWRAYIQKVIETDHNKTVITSGFEFFRERYNWSTFSNKTSATLSDNTEKRQYENLFVQMESSFSDKIFLSAGINGNLTRFYYFDNFIDDGDQSGKHSYKPIISPRIGINGVINPKISMFANLSYGFSTPSFEETLLPEGKTNPDIKPESGMNAEIGLRSQLSDRVQFLASYYRIYIKNLLVARRTGEDAYIGVNAGKSLHPGFETELKVGVTKPGSLPSLTLVANGTFANYHFADFVDNGINYSGNLLPGTSKNSGLIAAYLNPTKNIALHFWYRTSGKMPVNDANSEFSKAYGISNIEIKYLGVANKFKVELKAGIQNLFDIKYASMLAVNAPSFGGRPARFYYPGNPRNYFVSIILGIE